MSDDTVETRSRRIVAEAIRMVGAVVGLGHTDHTDQAARAAGAAVAIGAETIGEIFPAAISDEAADERLLEGQSGVVIVDQKVKTADRVVGTPRRDVDVGVLALNLVVNFLDDNFAPVDL